MFVYCLLHRIEVCALVGLTFFYVEAAQNSALGQQTDFRHAFLQDYEPHAAKLQERYSNVSVKYTRIYDMGNGDSQEMEVEGEINTGNYLLRDSRNRIINEKTKQTKRELGLRIIVLNPYYYFQLRGAPEGAFKLQDLKFPSSTARLPDIDLRFPFIYLARSQTYLALARDEKVRITGYQNGIWQKKNMKQLTYEYEFYHPTLKKNQTAQVKSYFSPDAGWVCCGEECLNNRKIYSYEESRNGELPVPVRVEDLYDGRALFTTVIAEYRRMPPFDDAEFRLSAFGLPEPMGVPAVQRGIRWYWWLTLGGFASLILAAAFWMWKGRWHKPVSKP